VASAASLILNRSDVLSLFNDVSGSGSLVVLGGSTATLLGSNSYSGATTVAGGTLDINGSLTNSSALTVSSGGTLGGTGTNYVNTVVNGTLAPGVNGVGTLTIGGNASLSLTNSSSITSITIASPTSFGQLAYPAFGTFTIGGTLNFNLYTISAPVVFTNTVLDAASYGNTISGDFTSVYVGTNALINIGTDGGGQTIWGGSNNNIAYQFSDGTGQLTVTSSVPEPSTNALLLVASLGTLFVVVRRRRAASR
jgi:fibronectin-binding autotransporter adhesin